MKRLSLFLTISGIVMVMIGTGCTFFTPPKDRPVIEDQVGRPFNEKIGTLATDATRRAVIVDLKTREFCAEAPPDVAENVTSQFALALEASAKVQDKVQADTVLKAASTLARAVQQLGRRTQGMQLFRDGMYNLCQGYVNKAIDQRIYAELFVELMKTSATLISQEIPQLTVQDYARSEIDEKAYDSLKEIFEKLKKENLKPIGPMKEPTLQDKPGTQKEAKPEDKPSTEKDEDTGSESSQ